jgi:hypothetical protein
MRAEVRRLLARCDNSLASTNAGVGLVLELAELIAGGISNESGT